jgi:glycosyltransferase involved in cell wall biosynthesis
LSEAARPLDILVVSQFFSPEMGAPAARFHDFGRMLVERGHRMRVITGFPNSPSGVVPEAYRGRFSQHETIDGIEVIRGWLFTSPRLTPVTKSLCFGSFAASASLRALATRDRPDVVIATSPPPTVGIPGILAARRLRAPMVFDVRDIWPEAIALSGRLRSGALIRALEGVERSVYRAAAAVTVVTEGKRQRLMEKGVAESKLAVIPNGVDLSRFDEVDDEGPRVLREAGVDLDRFVVCYAGVFNPPQGLDILVDAAARLKRDHPEEAAKIQIALVGNGSLRAHLENRVREEGLSGAVVFVGEQPRDRIPSILVASDAVAVTLRPRRDTHTVPSKIYEAMASGRPVLLSADGAPAEIIAEAGAGLATAAADLDGLVSSIRRLAAHPEEAAALGHAGRDRARASDRRLIVDRFEDVLQRVVAASPRR